MKKRFLYFSSILFLIVGCQGSKDRLLTPIPYANLEGWTDDTLIEALPAMRKSCAVLLKKSPTLPMMTRSDGSGTVKDWEEFCTKLEKRNFRRHSDLREFLEFHLQPYKISTQESSSGIFTGYYEPILRGSRKKQGIYHVPLYKLPSKSVHYKIPRSQIVAGALRGKNLELVWVDDPIAAFFIQIQGSGRVHLDKGQEIRLGYAGQNGYPYFPIGKELIDRGALKTEQVNMHTIRKWLKDHPRQAESVMSKNQSYVFFREVSGQGPTGSHGVPLTPKRSIAVDPKFIPLGSPLWLQADSPQRGGHKLQRLVLAQDTGGAIKGAIRGDLFWGHGVEAANLAGLMNSKGYLYLLLPR